MKTYYVIYRTGGTLNAQWHRSLEMSKELAEQTKLDIEKGGRKCLVVDCKLSDAIGLPEGYEYIQQFPRKQ